MIPWKILKFKVAKDVISCTLGAKQGEIKVVIFDSKLSAVSPFRYYFLHEASQFVSIIYFHMNSIASLLFVGKVT